MATTASDNTYIDPLRQWGTYNLQLGAASGDKRTPDPRYYNVRYNHKPRRSARIKRKTTLEVPSLAESLRLPTIKVSDRQEVSHDSANQDDSQQSLETHEYTGRCLDSSQEAESFALIIHHEPANSASLLPLAQIYAFNTIDKVSHGDATTYNPWDSQQQSKDAGGASNGTVASAFSSVAPSPAHSANGEGGTSLDEEEIDPKNPFDWRHYIDGIPGSSPNKSTNGTGTTQRNGSAAASAAPTPVSLAPSPLAKFNEPIGSSPSLQPARPMPRSEPASGPSNEKKQTLKRRRKQEPTVLPRSAPQRPRNVSSASALSSQSQPLESSRPATPSIQVENPTPTITSHPNFKERTRPHAKSEPKPTASDPNELIIEGDDDRPYTHQGRSTPSLMTPPGGRPMSLREAASRNASPMMPPRSYGGHSRSRLSGGPGSTLSRSGARQGLGIMGLDAGVSEVINFGDGDDGGGEASRRSNGDVETDFELGSPAYAPESPKLDPTPEHQASNDEEEMEQKSPEQIQIEDEEPRRVEPEDVVEDDDEFKKAFENALEEASNEEEAEGMEEVEGDDDKDLGDALAEALAAEVAGDEQVMEEAEESEEE